MTGNQQEAGPANHEAKEDMESERHKSLYSDYGRVAQLVEQRIENPRVGSSILPPATTFKLKSCSKVCGFFVFGARNC